MSHGEVSYWNQILEICLFSTIDMLYLRVPCSSGSVSSYSHHKFEVSTGINPRAKPSSEGRVQKASSAFLLRYGGRRVGEPHYFNTE